MLIIYYYNLPYGKNWELIKTIVGTNLEEAMFIYIFKQEKDY